jgi:hypothetical protein
MATEVQLPGPDETPGMALTLKRLVELIAAYAPLAKTVAALAVGAGAVYGATSSQLLSPQELQKRLEGLGCEMQMDAEISRKQRDATRAIHNALSSVAQVQEPAQVPTALREAVAEIAPALKAIEGAHDDRVRALESHQRGQPCKGQ